MKRYLLATVALVACCSTPVITLSVPAVAQTSHPGGNTSASATPLWDAGGFAWYLTAKHAVPVATVGGQEVVGTFPHPKLDLAILKVKGTVVVGSTLAQDFPRFGDRLRALGYGAGRSLQMTDGRASGKLGEMTCPIIFGCSGGAVLNERGELLGILRRVVMLRNDYVTIPVPHLSIYVPILPLKSWLLSTTGV